MSFAEFVKKERARQVGHVREFVSVYGRYPTLLEMNDMFGFTDDEHVLILEAARGERNVT